MDWEFIHEQIEVEFARKPGPPAAFLWRGERQEVAEALRGWANHGFGPFRYPARWWQRRHRNYFRVRMQDGRLADLYLDRGSGKWVLYRITKRPARLP